MRLRHALSLPSTLLLSAGSWVGSGPTSRGRQVAVLRLHAAVSLPRNDCTILAELSERITQLQYLLQLSLRTSEKAHSTQFGALGQEGGPLRVAQRRHGTKHEVAGACARWLLLRRTSQNSVHAKFVELIFYEVG